MSEHTPRQWKIFGKITMTGFGYESGHGFVAAVAGDDIAHARLIVKAVNNFEGLVKALEHILTVDAEWPFSWEGYHKRIMTKIEEIAKTALAAAKEEG